MLNVFVTEVGLQRPRVVPLVGQRIAARVPEHVWVRLGGKLRLCPSPRDHAGKPGGAERCPALRGEHERRLRLLLALETTKCPQFIPRHRVRAGRALLHTPHMKRSRGEIKPGPSAQMTVYRTVVTARA